MDMPRPVPLPFAFVIKNGSKIYEPRVYSSCRARIGNREQHIGAVREVR